MPFAKRPSELTAEDIQRLCDEQFPEGSQLELKATLPTRKGTPEPWTEGEDRIGDRARNELIAEVIAFANAHGGWLVVGVEETDDKPARASAVAPVRACVELAERLRLQCRDCIEPKLAIVEVAGVPIGDDGSGVVALHVPRSRMAPHRHAQDKECYTRRADRTEKMTMREIQDMTLHVERGIAEIERRFESWRLRFENEFNDYKNEYQHVLGIRMTLISLAEIYINHVHNNLSVEPPRRAFSLITSAGAELTIAFPGGSAPWRPTIRGSISKEDGQALVSRRSIYCNGDIDYTVFLREKGYLQSSRRRYCLYLDWLMSMFGNALCAAERFRRAAKAPEAEYGFEIQITNTTDIAIMPYTTSMFLEQLGPLLASNFRFPRYSVDSCKNFEAITQRFERDLLNAAGHDIQLFTTIDFEQALRELGLLPDTPEAGVKGAQAASSPEGGA